MSITLRASHTGDYSESIFIEAGPFTNGRDEWARYAGEKRGLAEIDGPFITRETHLPPQVHVLVIFPHTLAREKLALYQSQLHHAGRHIWRACLLKVWQIHAAIGSPLLSSRLCAP